MVRDSIIGAVPDSWKPSTLGEACRRGGGDIQTGPFGSQLHASDYVAVGIPSIMPQNIGDNRVVSDGIARITEQDAERLSRYRVRKGDIIYSRRGDVERRAFIREEEDGWLCGTGCLRVRFGEGPVDPLFASYYLGHPDVRDWVVGHAVGTTMPNLNTSILSALPFVAPPINEQRTIGRILGALDDRIDLNRQMNRTLEAMTRGLFKSWFVDFDPVAAKAAGRKPYGTSEEIAALFPDAFEDSKLGAIPKGWNVRQVKDLGSVVCGKTPSTKEPDNFGSEIPFITIPDMHGVVFVTQTERSLSIKGADSQVKKYLPENSICVSCIATPGLVSITSKLSQTNQQINSVIPHAAISPYFCYWLLRNLGDEIRAGGSGGTVFYNLNTGNFSQIEIIVPGDTLIEAFHSSCEGMMKMILENQRQSQTLSDLRDLLLPKLLSGEIRVRQAENLVAEAV